MMYYDKIKELRKQSKLTQAHMAEYLGISQQGYALYESGKRKIDFETALKIAEKLKVSLDELGMNFRNQSPEKSEITSGETNEKITILCRHLQDIPEDDREELIDTLENTINLYLKAKGLK